MSKLLNVKVRRKQYAVNTLNLAFSATANGVSVYKAARQYGVPESTLRDRTRGNVQLNVLPGPETLLTHSEEKQLVDHVSYMANLGYGYTKVNIQYLASDFAVYAGKKEQTNKPLSDCWFYGFMQRWPSLELVKPQKLSLLRAKCASKEILDKYFSVLSTILMENNLLEKPGNIYNIDETDLMTEHNPPKIVCDSKTKPQSVTSKRGQTVTLIGCGNAMGNFIPTYYIFPGKRWNEEFLNGTPPGSAGEMSANGWSNSVIFQNYLSKHFIKHQQVTIDDSNQSPTLILYDGHKSHISLTLVEWAKEHGIILFVLPPHTSHLTQPLDIGVFGPLKRFYYSGCQKYMRENPGMQVTKYDIGKLTYKSYLKAMCPVNLCSAFKKSGIYPFSNTTIPATQVAPAAIYPPSDEEGNILTQHKEQDNVSARGENLTDSRSAVVSEFFKEKTITTAIKKKKCKFVMPYLSGCLNSQNKSDILQSKEQIGTSSLTSTPPADKAVKSNKADRVSSSPSPGPSKANVDMEVYSNEDSESLMQTDDDSSNCCVCGKFQPPAVRESVNLVILKWAQCDKCQHWTHLIFCCDTRVVRRHSTFLCPHCQ